MALGAVFLLVPIVAIWRHDKLVSFLDHFASGEATFSVKANIFGMNQGSSLYYMCNFAPT